MGISYGVPALVYNIINDVNWGTLAVTAITFVIASRALKLIDGLKAVNFLPGLRIPFQPLSLLGVILPESTWNPGLLFTWSWRHTRNLYAHYGNDTISIVPYLSGVPSLYTQSMDVARQVVVAGHKSATFGKADSMSAALLFWGPSIVSSERDVWRKHRRIMGPAFNNETYALVWSASRNLYTDMLTAEGWNDQNTIDVPCVQTFTFKFTLIIIASCGFGLPFTWVTPPSHGGEMSIQECIQTISRTNTFAITAPKWAWKLPFKWVQQTRRAYDSMRAFMHAQVQERKKALHSSATREKDVFSRLVEASEDEGGKMALKDDELIGNIFAILFAGHETTAHTLAATLGFLALHEDIQEEVAKQVKEVTRAREGGEALLEDYPKLDKVLAAFYEGVRMFPSGVFLIREAKQDTTLTLEVGGAKSVLPIKKGTHIVVDMVGVQYNQKYFAEPEEFRPSRWHKGGGGQDKEDLTESEAFTAFSFGPRTCIGRKFATTEAVCLLSLLLRDWRVEPLLAPKASSTNENSAKSSSAVLETHEEWRARVMQATLELTMGIKNVPLRFVRRVY
ncbi:cytochrome P450 [Hygrophoropsis aurantiaca]|uniref:Cytochrome P450 n=1 Tax=Hygrophoropsis aurantiaca TaxID=72124 RepID=A0ACB8AKI2_9AGAM|nr:cytochrome P450 [Hygrophoropsis aurantiaca]